MVLKQSPHGRPPKISRVAPALEACFQKSPGKMHTPLQQLKSWQRPVPWEREGGTMGEEAQRANRSRITPSASLLYLGLAQLPVFGINTIYLPTKKSGWRNDKQREEYKFPEGKRKWTFLTRAKSLLISHRAWRYNWQPSTSTPRKIKTLPWSTSAEYRAGAWVPLASWTIIQVPWACYLHY